MRSASAFRRAFALQLLLLALALSVVAALQYRWIRRVSAAEHERLRRELDASAHEVARGITAEIRTVFESFLQPELIDMAPVVEHWLSEAKHPELVTAVYHADRRGDRWSLYTFDSEARAFVDAQWPPALYEMRDALANLGDRGPDPRWPPPFFPRVPALFIVQLPARMSPEFLIGQPRRVAIVLLDARIIEQQILPPLVKQHLGDNYDVALLGADERRPADVIVPIEAIPPRRPDPPRRAERPRPPPAAWQLAVTHRGGGIDAIADQSTRRNLAISAAVLIVLAALGLLLIAMLRRAEKLREQHEQFVAAMSHELNTPLAALRIAGENIEDGLAHEPEKLARYAQTIVKESARLSNMISEVLELSGMRAPRRTTPRDLVDVAQILADAVAQCRAAIRNAVPIDVHVEENLPKIHANDVAITRAVQNLLANALRHAGNNAVQVRARRNGNGGIDIAVEDRGPGVDREDVPHLFEPFYRGRNSVRKSGTGLGLTIVKEIVADHGGSVAYHERSGGGSVFTIHLPGEPHA